MSRSYKKAIYKDKGLKDIYWKSIRRTTNQKVKELLKNEIDEVFLPDPKSLINDYNYCDYTIDYEYNRSFSYFWYGKDYDDSKWKNKLRRK